MDFSIEYFSFEMSNVLENLLHSGFETPLYWAMISVNGCILTGYYKTSSEAMEAKITTEYFPESTFILSINIIFVDKKGDALE